VKALKRSGGYALLFLLSLVPSVIAYSFDATANQVGMVYVGAIIWCTLLWRGVRMDGVPRYVALGIFALIPAAIGISYGLGAGHIIQLLLLSVAWVAAFWGIIFFIEQNEALI
jgi:hypothetical protein